MISNSYNFLFYLQYVQGVQYFFVVLFLSLASCRRSANKKGIGSLPEELGGLSGTTLWGQLNAEAAVTMAKVKHQQALK
jgi:hypothetical protein